jgi:hypothetical protein
MPAELVEQIHGGRAPRLVDEVPDIPPTFAELVNQQLEYDPRRRAESARELVERLAEVETVGRDGD